MAPETEKVMLARMDERLKNIETTLKDIIQENSQRKCGENGEKIKWLEWLARLALGTSIVTMIKAFWFSGASH